MTLVRVLWVITFGVGALIVVAIDGFRKRTARQVRTGSVRATPDEVNIRVMTHNIRYAATDLEIGEAPWATRLPLLASQFAYHSKNMPESFICLQEVLHGQLVDLLCHLNVSTLSDSPSLTCRGHDLRLAGDSGQHEWAAIGVGRDDGKQAGEYALILYRPTVWKVKKWGTVWLSPEPMQPGWDAASVRIVTIARFQHLASHRELVVMNTHLDDQGPNARRKGAEIVVEVMKQWVRQHDECAIVLAGDLNSETDGDAYKIFCASLYEASKQCSGMAHYGEHYTFTGFTEDEEKQRLDYIFLGPRHAKPFDTAESLSVQGYAVLPNQFETEDGHHVYMSDHRAVVADLAWNSQKRETSGGDSRLDA